MHQMEDSGGSSTNPAPGQPTRDYGAMDQETAPHRQTAAGPADVPGHDAAGGETWNRVLGDNTSAGMVRLLGAVALFILVGASLFWLAD